MTGTTSRQRRRVRAVVVLCAGALLLAGCSASTGAGNEIVSISSPSASAATTEPVPSTGTVLDLAVPASVQALALVNQDGRHIPLSSLLGKTVVISPSLTQCQEICPLISANFAQSVAAVAKAGLSDKVVFLEVTVDPWRDDLAHLKAYQQLYGASANWQFLRADPAQITQFWDGMHLSFEKVPNAPGDHPKDWLTGKPLTFDIEHQNILYVLGPDGHIKWLVDASPNVAGARLPPRLEQFLSAEGIANQKSAADPNWTAQDLDQAIAYVTGHPVGG